MPSTMNSAFLHPNMPAMASAPRPRSMPTSEGAHLRLTRATSFGLITTSISWLFCGAVVLACLGFSSECVHWFVIPVFACGLIMYHDAVNWLRGMLDPFDPVGLLGVFGVHFFFFAPLLH